LSPASTANASGREKTYASAGRGFGKSGGSRTPQLAVGTAKLGIGGAKAPINKAKVNRASSQREKADRISALPAPRTEKTTRLSGQFLYFAKV